MTLPSCNAFSRANHNSVTSPQSIYTNVIAGLSIKNYISRYEVWKDTVASYASATLSVQGFSACTTAKREHKTRTLKREASKN